jgi:hypothetical protein
LNPKAEIWFTEGNEENGAGTGKPIFFADFSSRAFAA